MQGQTKAKHKLQEVCNGEAGFYFQQWFLLQLNTCKIEYMWHAYVQAEFYNIKWLHHLKWLSLSNPTLFKCHASVIYI